MDRLLSLFSLYDFFGYVLSGLALITGVWWAIAGAPEHAPGATAALGLVAAGLAVGHLVAAIASMWEGALWKARGGPPSQQRLGTGPQAFDPQAIQKIVHQAGLHSEDRPSDAAATFAIARAQLRASGRDERAELMNAQYGLCRNLGTSCLILVAVFLITGIVDQEWSSMAPAAVVSLGASLLYIQRAQRFGWRFVDATFYDFLALRIDSPRP